MGHCVIEKSELRFQSPNHLIPKSLNLFGGIDMQVFHVRYRNAQGTLMRILNAVSRRGLDLTSVHAEYAGGAYAVTLLLEVTPKQIGQLHRDWYAIVDVIEVRSGDARSSAAVREQTDPAWAPHPPASAAGTDQSGSSALA